MWLHAKCEENGACTVSGVRESRRGVTAVVPACEEEGSGRAETDHNGHLSEYITEPCCKLKAMCGWADEVTMLQARHITSTQDHKHACGRQDNKHAGTASRQLRGLITTSPAIVLRPDVLKAVCVEEDVDGGMTRAIRCLGPGLSEGRPDRRNGEGEQTGNSPGAMAKPLRVCMPRA